MINRILCLLCAAILMLGLFAACAKQNDDITVPSQDTSAPSQDTSTASQDTSAAALRDYGAWEGEWSRMDTGANTADITITNARAGMFDFSFFGMYVTPVGGANIGDLESAAHFTGENQAVCEYEVEYRDDAIVFGFVLEDGTLRVSSSENVLGLFGMNVTIDGVYAKLGSAGSARPARLSAAEARDIYNAWLVDHAELLDYTLSDASETYKWDGEAYHLFRAEEMSRYWYNILVHMETGELLFMMTPDGEDPETTIEPLEDWYNEHYAP